MQWNYDLTIKKRAQGLKKILFVLPSLAIIFLPTTLLAITRADELQASIAAKQNDIDQIQKDINELNQKLTATGATSKTLSGTINTLTITSKKLAETISLTENKISLANLKIEDLSGQIGSKTTEIKNNHESLGELFRELNQQEGRTLIEQTLSSETLAQFSGHLESLITIQKSLSEKIDTLKSLKTNLETNKSQVEAQEKNLLTLKKDLAGQKAAADSNRAYQAKLLTQTKNQESAYKKLLADKKAKEAQFEDELSLYQSQLKIELNPSLLPTVGSSALSWPLDSVIITQYFGNTTFSQTHAAVYNGKGHNGIDFGASYGTSIRSVRLGTVLGTGNTDLACPDASYGQWVLVKHDNGLSSLYAHLSVINVKAGEQVSTGQVIGYSGNSGYTTGPHLHFTVYASQAVEIGQLKSKVPGCGTYTLPLAPLNGYLNPLDYLPKLSS
jgi:murein DD-endopeptidase MepM/ murein hydrolase activator NlpD